MRSRRVLVRRLIFVSTISSRRWFEIQKGFGNGKNRPDEISFRSQYRCCFRRESFAGIEEVSVGSLFMDQAIITDIFEGKQSCKYLINAHPVEGVSSSSLCSLPTHRKPWMLVQRIWSEGEVKTQISRRSENAGERANLDLEFSICVFFPRLHFLHREMLDMRRGERVECLAQFSFLFLLRRLIFFANSSTCVCASANSALRIN